MESTTIETIRDRTLKPAENALYAQANHYLGELEGANGKDVDTYQGLLVRYVDRTDKQTVGLSEFEAKQLFEYLDMLRANSKQP